MNRFDAGNSDLNEELKRLEEERREIERQRANWLILKDALKDVLLTGDPIESLKKLHERNVRAHIGTGAITDDADEMDSNFIQLIGILEEMASKRD